MKRKENNHFRVLPDNSAHSEGAVEAPNSLGNDPELIGLLRSGLDSLDRAVPFIAPRQQWLLVQLEERRRLARRGFIRDVTLFILTALFILAGLTAAYFQALSVFLLLQAAGLLALPAVLLMREWKRVKGR